MVLNVFVFAFQFALAETVPNFVKSATPALQKRYETFFQNPSPEEYDKLVSENYNQIGLLSELLRRQATSQSNAAGVANVLDLKLNTEKYFIRDMVYSSAAYNALENSNVELVKKFVSKIQTANIRPEVFCGAFVKNITEGAEKGISELEEYIPVLAGESTENTKCYSYDANGHQVATGLEKIIQTNNPLFQKLLNERVKIADSRVKKNYSAPTNPSSVYFCSKEQITSYLDAAMKVAKKLKPSEKYAFLNRNESCQFGGALTYTTKNDFEFSFIGNPGQGVFQISFASLKEGSEKILPFQKQMPAGILSAKDIEKHRKGAEAEAAAAAEDRKKVKPIAAPVR